MKISVITVTLNSCDTIEDAVRSVNRQDYSDVEHIIIDGGSTDATLDIVKKHGERVASVVSEKDEGIYDALNKGIETSTGDIVGFLHSDDIFADERVLTRIAETFREEAVDAVYGDLNYVSKLNTEAVVRRWVGGNFRKSKFKNGWMLPHPTMYMRRINYLSFGGFNVKFSISADYDSMLRYFWKHDLRAAYIPSVLVNMRVGGVSNRSLRNIYRKMKEDSWAMKENEVPVMRALLLKNISKITQFF